MADLKASGVPTQSYCKKNHADRDEWKEVVANGGTTWIFEGEFKPGDKVISAYDKRRGGFKVEVAEDGTLTCFAAGEAANFTVESSINVCDGKKHHIAWISDTSACISYLVIDGVFDNGGDVFECGWRFIPRQLSVIRSVSEVSFGEGVSDVRLIPNAILTADAIGDWRASL